MTFPDVASGPQPARIPTVLVVDDDEDLLQLVDTYLSAEGFSVLRAVGSVEAQEICGTHPTKLDLILLDIMLYPPAVSFDSRRNTTPRIHGEKLLPILRTKRPLTRVLIMSATSPHILGGRGMGWLVQEYPFLSKPFTREQLVAKVRDVLNSPVTAYKATFRSRSRLA